MVLRLFLCGLGLASGCNGLGCCRLILVFRLAVFGVWFWLGSDLFSFVYYLIYNVLNFVYVCLRQIFFLPLFCPLCGLFLLVIGCFGVFYGLIGLALGSAVIGEFCLWFFLFFQGYYCGCFLPPLPPLKSLWERDLRIYWRG